MIDHEAYGGYGIQDTISYTQEAYDTLSFWVHGGPLGGQEIRVYLTLDPVAYTTTQTVIYPQANSWTKVEIPIADLDNPAAFDGVVFSDVSGTDDGDDRFYLDDVRFVAVKPDRVSIYDDALNNEVVFSSYGWDSTAFTLTQAATVLSGTAALELSYPAATSGYGIDFSDQLHTTGLQNIRFAVHGGPTGGQEIGVYLAQDQVTYSSSVYTITLLANQWVTHEISMSDFGWVGFFDGLEFAAVSGNAATLDNPFYIDNLSFGLADGPSPVVGSLEEFAFGDAMGANWSGTAWSPPFTTFEITDTEAAGGSSHSILVDYSAAGEFDVTHSTEGFYSGRDYEAVRFMIKGEAGVSQSLTAYMWNGQETDNASTYVIADVPDVWTEYVLPLSTFGSPSRFDSISWVESNASSSVGLVWFDEIKWIGRAPELTAEDYISVTTFPSDNQLYQRDVPTNTALVPISGTVIGSDIVEVGLTLERDDVLIETVTQTVSYGGGMPTFQFTVPITADAALYDFAFYAIHGNNTTLSVTSALSVTAGDIPIVASDYVTYTEFPSNGEHFIRNSGTNLAQVPITGTIIGAGVSEIGVKLEQDDVLVDTFTKTVTYDVANPPFTFTIPITGGSFSYDFTLYFTLSGSEIEVVSGTAVTSGDEPVLATDVVTVDAFPTDNQVITRDAQTFLGYVPISGTIILTGATEIGVRVEEDNTLIQTVTQTVSYGMSATPQFSFTIPITYEATNYDFELYVIHANTELSVISSTNVTVDGKYPTTAYRFPRDLYLYDDELGGDVSFTYEWDSTTHDPFDLRYQYSGWASYVISYNTDFAGVAIHTVPTITQGSYEKLSFWVNGGVSGGQSVRVYLALNGTAEDESVTFSPQTDLWTHIEIPMASLGDPAQFNEVIFQEAAGSKNPIFIDELVLHAPVSTYVWVYDDLINTQIVSQERAIGSMNFTTTQSAIVAEGSAAIELSFPQLGSGYGVEFDDQLHSDMVTGLVFNAHGGSGGNQQIGIYLAQDQMVYPSSLYTLPLQANQWATYTLSMEDFGWVGFFDEIRFVALSDDVQTLDSPLYLDEIKLAISQNSPPPTGNLVETIYDEGLATGWTAAASSIPTTTFATDASGGVNGSNLAMTATFGAAADSFNLTYVDNETYSSGDYDSLSFSMKGESGVAQAVQISLWSDGQTSLSHTYLITTVSDSWLTYTLSLTAFGSPARFDEIRWTEMAGDGAPYGTIWLDNVQLNGREPALSGADYVSLGAFPSNLQLYPRDLQTNMAQIPVTGTVIGAAVTEIGVRLEREGVLIGTYSQTVSYDSGTPSFAFALPITAELASYDVELYMIRLGKEAIVGSAVDVVAGDAYIISGQSNSTASSSLANESHNFDTGQNRWVRTFGDSTETESFSIADDNWYIGNGNTGTTGGGAAVPGSVGLWGVKFGISLTQKTQVPVALINGGHPGQAIHFFVPELFGVGYYEADPNDYDTFYNYGRLYRRVSTAGLQNDIRSILWYQGEGNLFGFNYETGFDALYDLWSRDYPDFEQIYMFQVRDSTDDCGTTEFGGLQEIQEVIRTMGDRYDKVTPVSTNGVDGHDGCHYLYTDGYERLGERIFEIVANDLYSMPLPTGDANLHGPNLAYAYFSNEEQSEIVLVTRRSDDVLIVEPGAEANFELRFLSVTVTQVITHGNRLTLTLSEATDGDVNGGFSYYGQPESGPWIKNSRGVGMLSFGSVYVEDGPPAVITPTVSLSLTNDSRLIFDWGYHPENCTYSLYNGNDPYSGTPVSLGDREHSYTMAPFNNQTVFYWLNVTGCEGGAAASTKHGAFVFALQPGQ